jgi:hypothetical protein
MTRPLSAVLLLCGGVAALCAASASSAPPLPAPKAIPFRTAIIPNPGLGAYADAVQFGRIKSAGAAYVRIEVNWGSVAPKVRPVGFDPTNPAEASYDWTKVDTRVLLAAKKHLTPILGISGAPRWAQPAPPPDRDGAYKPNPNMFGEFVLAAATRYGGSFENLPRVYYWRAWNEPNNYRYLTPQKENGKDFAPGWYAKLLSAFSTSVHAVHSDSHVVAGSLAPYGKGNRISPLTFMHELFLGPALDFDIFSLHPYTRGNPFDHASNPKDVALADLPKVRKVLNGAWTGGHILTPTAPQLWVTEFAYNTHPASPSDLTLPISLSGRYTAESLYQMWRSGASLGTWFLVRDEPITKSPFQCGLYFAGSAADLSKDRPKPALTAFRFPFVAYQGTPPAGPSVKKTSKKVVTVWGRTPTSRRGKVVIQVKTKSGWRKVGKARARSGGVFTGKLKVKALHLGKHKKGVLRARFAGQSSWPFSLKRPRDRFVLPLG